MIRKSTTKPSSTIFSRKITMKASLREIRPSSLKSENAAGSRTLFFCMVVAKHVPLSEKSTSLAPSFSMQAIQTPRLNNADGKPKMFSSFLSSTFPKPRIFSLNLKTTKTDSTSTKSTISEKTEPTPPNPLPETPASLIKNSNFSLSSWTLKSSISDPWQRKAFKNWENSNNSITLLNDKNCLIWSSWQASQWSDACTYSTWWTCSYF